MPITRFANVSTAVATRFSGSITQRTSARFGSSLHRSGKLTRHPNAQPNNPFQALR